MRIAVYPGTFDPIHNGHIDVIERAAGMFDKVIVVIAKNSKKVALFDEEKRLDMVREALSHLKNVEVEFTSGLLVDLAKKKQAIAIIRGLRTVSDFEYEMQIGLMNRKMSDIPTVFMIPHEKYSYLTSSIVREISSYGQDISEFVPENVQKMLQAKFQSS